jgi:ATP-binding cassette, subfamily F, member 3
VMASRRDRTDSSGESDVPNRRVQRKQEAAERQRLTSARRPLQSRLTRLEKELAKVSGELRELDARLADPDFYHAGDEAVVAATLKQRGELSRQVEALEVQWLELTQEIEAIE